MGLLTVSIANKYNKKVQGVTKAVPLTHAHALLPCASRLQHKEKNVGNNSRFVTLNDKEARTSVNEYTARV